MLLPGIYQQKCEHMFNNRLNKNVQENFTYKSPKFKTIQVSIRGFPGGSDSKNLPAMQETGIQSMGWEDPLEKEKATQLQYSGLENSMDIGVQWDIVHGVPKSQTRLNKYK